MGDQVALVDIVVYDLTGLKHGIEAVDAVFVVNDNTYGEPYDITDSEDGTRLVLVNVNGISCLVQEPHGDNS